MKTAYIVSPFRTAVGKAGRGTLRSKRPDDLCADVIKAIMKANPSVDPHAIDDVFIACYVSAAVLAALALKERSEFWLLAAIAGVSSGLLDLEENHQLLAFLVQAQHDIPLTAASLEHRMVFSSLKWLIGPIGYCFLALSYRPRSTIETALGGVSWGFLLPLTAVGMAVEDPVWSKLLAFARLFSVLAGFVLLALALRGRARGSDSSVPRSLPGTQPAVAG